MTLDNCINPQNYGAIVYLGSCRILSISSSIYLHGLVYTLNLNPTWTLWAREALKGSEQFLIELREVKVIGSWFNVIGFRVWF